MQETVVFVHGVWMTGLELIPLRRRVSACGYQTHQFRYPSLRRAPRDNALALARFLDTLDADIVHLVAHSLGGILLCHLFAQQYASRPGRVLMLGTPLRGSVVAHVVWRHHWARWLLGRSCAQGLLGDAPRWPAGRELGMIAGNRGIGIGTLLAGRRLPSPNDGTVAMAETEDPAVTDHLEVPYSHFTMLFARPVARAVCHYLQSGRFIPR